jgi:hypothetical protein
VRRRSLPIATALDQNGNTDAALAASGNLPLHSASRLCCQADRQDEGVGEEEYDRLDAISIVAVPSHLVSEAAGRPIRALT